MRANLKKTAAMMILGALVLASCSTGGADESTTAPSDGVADAGSAAISSDSAEIRVALGGPSGPAAPETALTDPGGITVPNTLIRQADLQLRVEAGSFDERWEAVRRIATDLGGYIGDAATGIDERGEVRYAYGTATVRIPAERFDDALDRLGALGDRLSLSMSGTDVTEEYVDLEARLEHWRAVEEFTLGLLDQATTIDEAIRVQQRLNDIQLTVEQLEGRIRYLDSRTDLATVTIGLTESPVDVIPVVEPDPTPGPIAEAVDQAVEVLLGTVGFLIVAAAFLLPLSLVALALALGYRGVRRAGAPRPDVP